MMKMRRTRTREDYTRGALRVCQLAASSSSAFLFWKVNQSFPSYLLQDHCKAVAIAVSYILIVKSNKVGKGINKSVTLIGFFTVVS